MRRFRFTPAIPDTPALTAGDGLILLGIATVLYAGVRLAFGAPAAVRGPELATGAAALPWYAFLSLARMVAAYALALAFSLGYGWLAARSPAARKVMMPLLDVLQSVPILSFLPVVLLSLSAVVPAGIAAEVAAVVLIFTSQVWNIAFGFYQSCATLPKEMGEAAAVYRFSPWLRFRCAELPFGAIGLVWNSMMGWAGGWFFLMAAESFRVGPRDFRLPGLGSYLQIAADRGDLKALAWGIATLVVLILLLDQLVWRPLIAWAHRFKVETVEEAEAPESWFLDALTRSRIARGFHDRVFDPALERLDRALGRLAPGGVPAARPARGAGVPARIAGGAATLLCLWGGWKAGGLLAGVPGSAWAEVGTGLLATFARVAAALGLALAWTVPVGVLIGTRPRAARVLQPLVQLAASVPATALFPALLLLLLKGPGGLDVAAVALMLLGTQWYVLFNVIAGASAIPQDLRHTAALLNLSRGERWRTLTLPALFPYIITGAITAGGGAWNASIVAEYVQFGGRVHATAGVGALIARATAAGDYPVVLAATLALVVTVVLVNRLFWLRLYRLAEERYRLE
jgi:NitT/TauT family transport system permease protein